jgi:hypothetical protein
MAEPKTAIEPLSLREVAFEHFEEFFESIIEQAQFTPEQQLALGEQLKASVEKRDKLGNCLAWLEGQAGLLREKEKQLAERRRGFEKFYEALRSSLHQQMLDWGVKKVEGQEFSFTVKKNQAAAHRRREIGGKQLAVRVRAFDEIGCEQFS